MATSGIPVEPCEEINTQLAVLARDCCFDEGFRTAVFEMILVPPSAMECKQRGVAKAFFAKNVGKRIPRCKEMPRALSTDLGIKYRSDGMLEWHLAP